MKGGDTPSLGQRSARSETFQPWPSYRAPRALLAEVPPCTLPLFSRRCRRRPGGPAPPFRFAGSPRRPPGPLGLPVHPYPPLPRSRQRRHRSAGPAE